MGVVGQIQRSIAESNLMRRQTVAVWKKPAIEGREDSRKSRMAWHQKDVGGGAGA
jgi:hypothetical protein